MQGISSGSLTIETNAVEGAAVRERLRRGACIFLIGLAVCLPGCAVYHPKPITGKAVGETLGAPDMVRIKVEAGELRHPILKPVEVDMEEGLSPDGAAVIAVIANPTLRAARDARGVAAAQLLQAGILPNPVFSYSLDKPTGGNTEGTVNAFGLGVSFDLIPLITRGAQVAAARAGAASVDLGVAWQEWQAALAAKAHVYNLVFIQNQLATAREEEKALRDNLKTVQEAFDYGDVTEIDLAAAQTALQKVHASALILHQQHEQERLALNQSLGFPPGQIIPLRAGISPPSIENTPQLSEMLDGIQESRLDLVALRFGYESQEARLRAAVLSQFPTLAVGPTHARDTTNVVTTGFTVAMDIPVFNRNQGQIAIERATRQQLFDEYLARLFDARASIAATLGDMRAVEAQVDSVEHLIPVTRKLVDTYRIALLEGHADVITYYNALNDLYGRQVELLSLKKDLSDLIIALEVASGRFLTGLPQGGAVK